MEQTVKKKFGIRDIMTIAAMMVINFAIAMVIGMVTLPFPAVYLYGSAGIDAFIGATFYLVAANRINKHGLLFAWATVYGLIQGVMGYMFLVPYFLIVALIAELCMAWQEYIPKCSSQPNWLDGQLNRKFCRLCRTAVVGLGQLSGNGSKQRF